MAGTPKWEDAEDLPRVAPTETPIPADAPKWEDAEETEGVLSRAGNAALQGLGWVANKIDSVTGAPVRRGIVEAMDGKGAGEALSAAASQFGADAATAPTGKDIAKRLGVTDETPLSERVPWLYDDTPGKSDVTVIPPFKAGPIDFPGLGVDFRPAKGGLADVSPAGVAGFATELGTDPTMFFPPAKAAKLAGAAMKGGKAAAVKAAVKANKIGNKVLFNVPGEVTERYLKNAERIRKAGTVDDLAENIAKQASKIGDDVSEFAEEAKAIRRAGGASSIDDVLKTYDGLIDDAVTDAEKATLTKRRNAVQKLKETSPDFITDDQLYKEIKELDDVADWKSATPSSASAMANRARGQLREQLAKSNPEFGAKQAEIEKRIRARNALVKKFNLEKGTGTQRFQAGENASNAAKRLARSGKNDRKALLEEMRDIGYGDLTEGAQDILDKAALSRAGAQGSRRTLLGTTVGGALGLATGNPVTGAAIGATAGAAADQFAGRLARAAMDTQLFLAKNPATQKTANILERAFARSPQEYAVALATLRAKDRELDKQLRDAGL